MGDLYNQMKYKIDNSIKKPAYLQLYEEIKKDITSGSIPYGSKLPSKRILSEETGVSVITAEHAYSLLCDEGYAESRERSGYYSVFKPEEAILQNDEISYDSSFLITNAEQSYTRQDFPFSVISKAMRKILADFGEEILRKSPNKGCIELRTAISKYLERSRGIKAGAEQIIIGSGAEYLYGLIVEMLPKNYVYAIENPSYEKIELVYKAKGVKYEMLSLTHDGIKSSDLKNTKASLLHITPYRSFPSGVTASASKRREYIRWVNEKDNKKRFIVEDDYESEFTLSKKYKGWKFNIGPRVNNKNFTWDNDDNINVSLLFIDIPLLFSYDFDLGTNNTFRLELGPYYSQYIAGAIFIDNKKIAGAFNNGYYSPFNAGLIVGGGFWHNDFYIGADFDFIWDWAGEDAFPSFYMTAGYRF